MSKAKPKYTKIKDARTNFSKIIHSVETEKIPYVIGVRDAPKAVIVDLKTAKKYLPENLYNAEITSDSTDNMFHSGQKFAKHIKKIGKQKKKNIKKENISSNIDNILYYGKET